MTRRLSLVEFISLVKGQSVHTLPAATLHTLLGNILFNLNELRILAQSRLNSRTCHGEQWNMTEVSEHICSLL